MNTEQLLAKVRADSRTPEEIFESIKTRIKRLSETKMSEKEAIETTRNFIGFCECIAGIKKQRIDSNDGER